MHQVTFTFCGHIADVDALLVRHEAQVGENNEAGEEGREAVNCGGDEAITETRTGTDVH